MKYKILFFIFIPIFIIKIYAQREVLTDSINFKTVIKIMPSFIIFVDNYFITGPSLGEKTSSNYSDAKIQLGFK